MMGGFSRNCWHGVPRIIQGSFQREKFEEYLTKINFQPKDKSEENISDFSNDYFHTLNYLAENRINLNFR